MRGQVLSAQGWDPLSLGVAVLSEIRSLPFPLPDLLTFWTQEVNHHLRCALPVCAASPGPFLFLWHLATQVLNHFLWPLDTHSYYVVLLILWALTRCRKIWRAESLCLALCLPRLAVGEDWALIRKGWLWGEVWWLLFVLLLKQQEKATQRLTMVDFLAATGRWLSVLLYLWWHLSGILQCTLIEKCFVKTLPWCTVNFIIIRVFI